MDALRQKAESDPSILRGGAGTPAPVAEEAAVVEEADEPQNVTEVPAEDEAAAPAADETEAAPAAEADADAQPSEG
jgi:large subunit ribosomal protein L10